MRRYIAFHRIEISSKRKPNCSHVHFISLTFRFIHQIGFAVFIGIYSWLMDWLGRIFRSTQHCLLASSSSFHFAFIFFSIWRECVGVHATKKTNTNETRFRLPFCWHWNSINCQRCRVIGAHIFCASCRSSWRAIVTKFQSIMISILYCSILNFLTINYRHFDIFHVQKKKFSANVNVKWKKIFISMISEEKKMIN